MAPNRNEAAPGLTEPGTATEKNNSDADQRVAAKPILGDADRAAAARAYLAEFFTTHTLNWDGGSVRMALGALTDDGREWAELVGFRPDQHPIRTLGLDLDGMLDGLAKSAVLTADLGHDVYCSPYAHPGHRQKGGAVARRHVHADIDGPLVLARVRMVGGMAVASGSVDADGKPHGHVYVRLDRDVPPHVHEALCGALGKFLSPDHHDTSKVADVDVLRVPGTLNHKTDPPRPVEWLIRPDDQRVNLGWEPEALATLLGLAWPIAEPDDSAMVVTGHTEAETVGPRSEADGMHPYAARAIGAELARLDDAAGWPAGIRDARGRGWEAATFEVACNLREFGNSPWSGYTLEQAHADLLEHAPQDRDFGPVQHEEKWRSAGEKVRGKGRPDPAGKPSTRKGAPRTAPADSTVPDSTTTKGGSPMIRSPHPRMAATRPGTAGGPPWQDTDLRSHQRIAARLAQWMQGRCLYVPGAGWHAWDTTRWAPDLHEVRVHEELTELLKVSWDEAVGAGPGNLDKDLMADVKSASTGSGGHSVLDLASRSPLLVAEAMDADPWVLNCTNGTLDLHTLQLRPHDPADGISKVCSAAYDPQARAPEWETFLASSLPDPQVRAFLQRVAGLALIGEVREDVLVFAAGVTRAGKGVVADTVSAALGDYAVTVDNELLVTDRRGGKKSAGEASELMRLRGARWAVMSELDRSQRINEARMKALTSRDRITAKLMRQDMSEFDPSHTFLVLTNGLPRVSATDEAVWARVRVIPFTVSFLGREDPELRDRLELELEGVLAWAVDGLRDYLERRRLDPPEAVLEASRAYRTDNDPLGRFIAERCHLTGGEASIARSAFLDAFNVWAREANESEMTAKAMAARMEQWPGVHDKKRRDGRYWAGITLTTEHCDD